MSTIRLVEKNADLMGISNHFMGIVRNGIMKQYGKSPEDVIADQMKGKVSGVGSIIGAVVGIVIKLISVVVKLFKGKKGKIPKVTKDDAPDPADWGDVTASAVTDLATAVQRQPENSKQYTDKMTSETTGSSTSSTALNNKADQEESGNDFESGGRSIWDSLKS